MLISKALVEVVILASETKEFLHVLLNICESLLKSGAEISRVEETARRMGDAFGAERTNVFAITSSIVLTLEMSDGEVFTETRRISSNSATDFRYLEALNSLSREYCAERFEVSELKRRYKAAGSATAKEGLVFAGSALAAGGFTVFFGGTVWDALVSAIVALFICAFQKTSPYFCPNSIVAKFLCSLISGVIICAVCKILPSLQYDKIMIGDIMLLIPGIALTNSISNIIVGDTVSGLTRLTESLVLAAALAGGFMLAIFIIGG